MDGTEFLQAGMDQPEQMPTLENWARELQQQVGTLTAEVTRQRSELDHAATAGQSSTGFVPKPTKPDTFSSSKESGLASAWLFSLKLYFEATEAADRHKVSFAATFLRGSAALWWQAHLAQADAGTAARIVTWEQFDAGLRAAFSPVNSVKIARDAIRSLSQTRSVQEYIDRFQALVLQIPDMSAAEQLDKFTAGLKPAIQEKVEIEGCDTLTRAMNIAQRIDSVRHRFQQQSRQSATSTVQPVPATPAISD